MDVLTGFGWLSQTNQYYMIQPSSFLDVNSQNQLSRAKMLVDIWIKIYGFLPQSDLATSCLWLVDSQKPQSYNQMGDCVFSYSQPEVPTQNPNNAIIRSVPYTRSRSKYRLQKLDIKLNMLRVSVTCSQAVLWSEWWTIMVLLRLVVMQLSITQQPSSHECLGTLDHYYSSSS